MPLPVDVLASEVLQLPTAERARLLNRIVDSLEQDTERDARWDAVAAQRDAEADVDPSTLLPADEVMARIRADVG